MEQSILISVKKILGVAEDDASFDLDIITFVNSAFSTLHQLGIGPVDGFMIEDDTAEWADFIIATDPNFNLVRTYVSLKSRISFDPPQTSYLIGALNEQIQELEWRLSTNREGTEWVAPPEDVDEYEDIYGDPLILEGGDA